MGRLLGRGASARSGACDGCSDDAWRALWRLPTRSWQHPGRLPCGCPTHLCTFARFRKAWVCRLCGGSDFARGRPLPTALLRCRAAAAPVPAAQLACVNMAWTVGVLCRGWPIGRIFGGPSSAFWGGLTQRHGGATPHPMTLAGEHVTAESGARIPSFPYLSRTPRAADVQHSDRRATCNREPVCRYATVCRQYIPRAAVRQRAGCCGPCPFQPANSGMPWSGCIAQMVAPTKPLHRKLLLPQGACPAHTRLPAAPPPDFPLPRLQPLMPPARTCPPAPSWSRSWGARWASPARGSTRPAPPHHEGGDRTTCTMGPSTSPRDRCRAPLRQPPSPHTQTQTPPAQAHPPWPCLACSPRRTCASTPSARDTPNSTV